MSFKKISIAFAVLSLSLLTCCALAQTLLLEEFNGTPGQNIVTLDWWAFPAYTQPIVISSNVIDSGNCAMQGEMSPTSNDWGGASKACIYQLSADEMLSLTYVSKTPGTAVTMAGIRDNVYGRYWQLQNWQGEIWWYTNYPSTSQTMGGPYVLPADVKNNPDAVIDMRMDFSATGAAFYWRRHGDADWIQIATDPKGTSSIMSVIMTATYFAAPDVPYVDSIKLSVASGSLTGHVDLEDFSGDLASVNVVVELMQNGTVKRTATACLNDSGNYTISGITPGIYDVAIKAPCWLRKKVQNVSIPLGGSGTANVSLLSGDLNGDNQVDSSDTIIPVTKIDQKGE